MKNKKMYSDLNQNLKNLKSKNCIFPYRKNGFKNFVDYKNFLKLEKQIINGKRKNRYNNIIEELSIQEKLKQKKHELFLPLLETIVKTNAGVKLKSSRNFASYVESETDWDYYAKSFKYPKKWNATIFEFDYEKFKLKYREYIILDGIINTEIISVSIENNIEKITANSIVRKKMDGGVNWVEIKMYIAKKGEYNYHSDKSIEDATKGLQRKIKKIEKNKITMETEINARLYQKITGACWVGVDNFLNSHNWDRKTKMKLKDLLPILENENVWGLNILKDVIVY